MPTPIGMNPGATLESTGTKAGLQRKGWFRQKIYMESLQADVYMKNMNLIEPIMVESSKDSIKINSDKMVIKLTAKDKDIDEGMDRVTLALTQSLQDAAVNGNAQYIGEEEELRYKYTDALANDFARPVAYFGYGSDKLNQDWLKGNDNLKRLLAQWLGETKGLHYRQAYCELISENLEAQPMNATKGINPNFYFPETGQVTYDSTLTDYATAINAASATITPANNHLTVPKILEIEDVAKNDLYIKPLMINGRAMYKLVVCPEELRLLRDATQTDSFAGQFISGSALANNEWDIKKVVPEAVMVIGDTIICEDVRNATATFAGVGATYSFGYKQQGRNSSRSTAGAGEYNVNMLCGAESVIEYVRDMIDYREQDDDYERNMGKLIRENSGCKLPVFDLDTPADTSAQYEGSLLIATSRESNIGG